MTDWLTDCQLYLKGVASESVLGEGELLTQTNVANILGIRFSTAAVVVVVVVLVVIIIIMLQQLSKHFSTLSDSFRSPLTQNIPPRQWHTCVFH